MHKTNLLSYLKQFSTRDWRIFKKFVRSPYYNERADLIKLFDLLEKGLKKTKRKELDKEIIFPKLYPNQTFNDEKIRHTTADLLKLIKLYLAKEAEEKEPFQNLYHLSKSLRRKKQESFFQKEVKNTHHQLDAGKYRNGKYFYEKYQIGMEEAIFSMTKVRNNEINFQASIDNLTIAFISNLLRLACNIQSQQTISEREYDLTLLPTILEKLQEGAFENTPAITIYFHIYASFQNLRSIDLSMSEHHFDQLKSLIQTHWRKFPALEIRDIYLFAINYCIKRLNSGKKEYIREAFELFRSGLKNETLLEGAYLSSFSFKNITRIGMALGENEWVETFLKEYKTKLHPRERENVWRYNLASFYFKQQNFQETMQLLLMVEFKDKLNNLDARRMLLKSYFELGEFNALDSLLDSFARYIQRQKEMGYHRENYLNLIKFVKKIISSNHQEKATLNQIREEIISTERLAERDWLLEKLK